MTIKTKRYGLDQKTYINLAFRTWLRDNLIWGLIPLGLILLNIVLYATNVVDFYWPAILIFVLTALYVIFWAIQFTGITQSAQFKPMFEKYIYEIDSRQILMRVNTKEGGILKWDQIKGAVKDKNAYVLSMGDANAVGTLKLNPIMRSMAKQVAKAQFLYLPFSIFTSDHDLRLMDTLLKRKGLLAEK